MITISITLVNFSCLTLKCGLHHSSRSSNGQLHWFMLVSASVVPSPILFCTAYRMLNIINQSLNKSPIVSLDFGGIYYLLSTAILIAHIHWQVSILNLSLETEFNKTKDQDYHFSTKAVQCTLDADHQRWSLALCSLMDGCLVGQMDKNCYFSSPAYFFFLRLAAFTLTKSSLILDEVQKDGISMIFSYMHIIVLYCCSQSSMQIVSTHMP